MPAEIAVEVFRRHAVEPPHPSLQPARVGIDVLDVIDAPPPLALALHQADMQNALLVGEGAERLLPPSTKIGGDEDRVTSDQRTEQSGNGFFRAVVEDSIRGRLVSVARNQNGNLLFGQATLFGFATAFARVSVEMVRAFFGKQENGLVGFHGAFQPLRLYRFYRFEKAMPPAEGGREIDLEALGHLAQSDAVGNGGGVLDPQLSMVQLGKRRVRQCVKSDLAILASIALQAVGGAPLLDRCGLAMRAPRRARKMRLDGLDRPVHRRRDRRRPALAQGLAARRLAGPAAM